MTTRARLKQKAKLKAAASRRMFVSTKSAVRCASQYDVQPPSLVGCKSCSDEARAEQTVPGRDGFAKHFARRVRVARYLARRGFR